MRRPLTAPRPHLIGHLPLVALLLLTLGNASPSSSSFSGDAVPHIPGYGAPKSPVYAGRLAVDEATRGVELFYAFTSKLPPPAATAAPPTAESVPIVVWFQGGGGASPPWGEQTGPFALDGYAGGGPSTFGMLCEGIGPFTNPDNATGSWVLEDNNSTWNTFAHLMFIDQPAGVGLSSFSAARNGYAQNGTALGRDVALALAAFFGDRHPELANNPLYLFGESYAGHYVPHIASYILDHGSEPALAALRRQLTGVGLGDVCPGEEHTLSLPELMRGLGYMSPEQLAQARATASRCKADLYRGDFAAAFKSCEALEVMKGLASGGIYDQDSRLFANYTSLAELANVDGATSEGEWMLLANAWLDEPATRSALHVPATLTRSVNTNQKNCTRGLWDDNDNARSTIAQWPAIVGALETLVYNGNFDVSCNFLGTETLLAALGSWFGDERVGEAYRTAFHARERRWFTLASEMAGYFRHVDMRALLRGLRGGREARQEAEEEEDGGGARRRGSGTSPLTGSLTHVIVQGAGHLAPRDQSARVQAMVGRWLADHSGATLCDERHGICRASDVALQSLGSRCALLFNCSGPERGDCTDEGRCRCQPGWSGADCSQGIEQIKQGRGLHHGGGGGGGISAAAAAAADDDDDEGGSVAASHHLTTTITTTTFTVAPESWQYHEIGAPGLTLRFTLNETATPRPRLPRPDGWIRGADGLVVYLAAGAGGSGGSGGSGGGIAWPPDPVLDDLAASFDRAWRIGNANSAGGDSSAGGDNPDDFSVGRVTISGLPRGARLGVKNHGKGYHAPARAYTVQVVAGGGQRRRKERQGN